MTASQTNSTSPPSPQEKEDEEEDLSMLPLPWLVIVPICAVIAIVTAVGGNVLVLLSYRRDRGLRNVHNLYLVHMAIADLTIGAVSMPFYLVYTVMYWTWAFGRPVCKTFLVVDFTACTMSTLAVVLVAWDRLILVKEGASYSLLETKRKAYGRLAVCWIFSFLLFSPAIVFWDIVRGYSILPAEECDVEFWTNFEYTAVTEITAFSVPMLSLLFINSRVYLALRKSRRQFARATDTLTDLGKASSPLQPTSANDGRLTVSIATSSAARSAYEHAFTHATSIKRQSRERRARIILTLLVIALVICWLPYSVATIILGWCSNCVDTNLYEFFHWLLYTKSSFNPFLYAYNSPRFRKNIIELLSPLLPAKCLERAYDFTVSTATSTVRDSNLSPVVFSSPARDTERPGDEDGSSHAAPSSKVQTGEGPCVQGITSSHVVLSSTVHTGEGPCVKVTYSHAVLSSTVHTGEGPCVRETTPSHAVLSSTVHTTKGPRVKDTTSSHTVLSSTAQTTKGPRAKDTTSSHAVLSSTISTDKESCVNLTTSSHAALFTVVQDTGRQYVEAFANRDSILAAFLSSTPQDTVEPCVAGDRC